MYEIKLEKRVVLQEVDILKLVKDTILTDPQYYLDGLMPEEANVTGFEWDESSDESQIVVTIKFI